jgi:glucokinase
MGFDLGGTKMLAVVLDEKYNVIAKAKKKTKGYKGAKEGIARIKATVNEALERAEITPDKLTGIGVAAPGPLNHKKGILENPTNLRWGNVKLKDILEDEFKCKVKLVNDVDAGVYGEYRFGAGKGARSLIGVFPGTGIGGGCVYEGTLIEGKESPCMEIGHIVVQPNGRLCGCGNRGCLETVASRLAISSELAMVAYRGDAPNLLAESGTDISKMGSGAIARSIKAGDCVVESVVKNAASWLGVGLTTVINLIYPDVVVLGGGLVEAMPELVMEGVKKSVKEYAFSNYGENVTIKAAECGDYASVYGAAALLDKG